MRFSKCLTLLLALAIAGCSSNSDPCAQSSATPSISNPPSGVNVLEVTVNGSLCNGGATSQYPNEPCTSVTICEPGSPSTCQTISDILVDTGSFGLRVFGSLVTLNLSPVTATNPAGDLADCVTFGDGSSEWGPVVSANVQLGGETAPSVPIQLIESGYSSPPSACSASSSVPNTTPQEAGFNGILGIGLLAQDCGSHCSGHSHNGQYYSCNGNSCSTTSATQQVQNPVTLLPSDFNGVLLQMPAIPSTCGVASATGYLVLGIGTHTNNVLSGATIYPTDQYGDFTTTFPAYSSGAIPGFIDSGSSELFIPSPTNGSLPDCSVSYGSNFEGVYCPSQDTSFSVSNTGNNGSPTGTASFIVSNAFNLLNSGNLVFSTIAGTSGSEAYFDWGLPFFYGRTVYLCIDNQTCPYSSGSATGPFYAY